MNHWLAPVKQKNAPRARARQEVLPECLKLCQMRSLAAMAQPMDSQHQDFDQKARRVWAQVAQGAPEKIGHYLRQVGDQEPL